MKIQLTTSRRAGIQWRLLIAGMIINMVLAATGVLADDKLGASERAWMKAEPNNVSYFVPRTKAMDRSARERQQVSVCRNPAKF